ncbi:MAG: hypothetical protein Q8P91_00305 [bacterium]|nr:hypothetical protein [bacterium]
MFGINVPIKHIEDGKSLIEEEVEIALKRNDERRVFRRFLESETLSGEKVTEKIGKSIKEEADGLSNKGIGVSKQILLDFAISRLKAKMNGNLSTYNTLIRKIVEDQHPEFTKLHNLLDKGKFDGKLPFGYPDASKNAHTVLVGKIKDTLPKIKKVYFEQKLTGEKTRGLTREMFYGVNKLGLRGEKLVNYLKIIFELGQIQTDTVGNASTLKESIAMALNKEMCLKLVLVKCLRFSYPRGVGLKLITHLGTANIEDRFGGIFLTTDESRLFQNLQHLVNIFKENGVELSPLVMVADNDLLDNFPQDLDDTITVSDVNKAQLDTDIYINELKLYSDEIEIIRFTEILESKGLAVKYGNFRKEALDSLRRGDGSLIKENVIEEMINFRFERDQALFVKATRIISRERIYQKMASMIAMQVLAEDGLFLVTNSHGNENKLVAGGKIPVFFTDLYEEKKVFENVYS